MRSIYLLAFLIITSVTSAAVILANVGSFGPEVANSEFAKWGTGAVLGEIVGATLLVFKRQESIFGPTRALVTLNFVEQIEADFCDYEVKDPDANVVAKGRLRLDDGQEPTSFTCLLPIEKVRWDHKARLIVIDDQGRRWRSESIYPITSTAQMKVMA